MEIQNKIATCIWLIYSAIFLMSSTENCIDQHFNITKIDTNSSTTFEKVDRFHMSESEMVELIKGNLEWTHQTTHSITQQRHPSKKLALANGTNTGGQPASKKEQQLSTQRLREIIDFENRFLTAISHPQMAERYQHLIPETYVNIIREKSERIVQFLLDRGVKLNIYSAGKDLISAQIALEGTSIWNQRARELAHQFGNVSMEISPMESNASYDSYRNTIELPHFVFISMNPKHWAIGHELRHRKNKQDLHRNFGYSKANGKDSKLPINENVYSKFQSFEEAETHSYTIRQIALEISKKMESKRIAPRELHDQMLSLRDQIQVAHVIAQRNLLVSSKILEMIRKGYKPELRINDLGQSVADFEMVLSGNSMTHTIVLPNFSFKGRQYFYDTVRSRVEHLYQLSQNYVVQFDVAAKAIIRADQNLNNIEIYAITSAIAGTTRPHFWEAQSLVKLNTEDQISIYNKVLRMHLERGFTLSL